MKVVIAVLAFLLASTLAVPAPDVIYAGNTFHAPVYTTQIETTESGTVATFFSNAWGRFKSFVVFWD